MKNGVRGNRWRVRTTCDHGGAKRSPRQLKGDAFESPERSQEREGFNFPPRRSTSSFSLPTNGRHNFQCLGIARNSTLVKSPSWSQWLQAEEAALGIGRKDGAWKKAGPFSWGAWGFQPLAGLPSLDHQSPEEDPTKHLAVKISRDSLHQGEMGIS